VRKGWIKFGRIGEGEVLNMDGKLIGKNYIGASYGHTKEFLRQMRGMRSTKKFREVLKEDDEAGETRVGVLKTTIEFDRGGQADFGRGEGEALGNCERL